MSNTGQRRNKGQKIQEKRKSTIVSTQRRMPKKPQLDGPEYWQLVQSIFLRNRVMWYHLCPSSPRERAEIIHWRKTSLCIFSIQYNKMNLHPKIGHGNGSYRAEGRDRLNGDATHPAHIQRGMTICTIRTNGSARPAARYGEGITK
jgi:hypothetical protein